MKKKLKIIIPLAVLIAGFAAYKVVLAKPPEKVHHKVEGDVYVLPKEFLVNLSGGQFAKLSVALVLAHGQLSAEGGHSGGGAPPEGFGPLPQEAVVRDIVTDTVTDQSANGLIDREAREQLKQRIMRAIHSRSDVKVEDVLFTDVAVQ